MIEILLIGKCYFPLDILQQQLLQLKFLVIKLVDQFVFFFAERLVLIFFSFTDKVDDVYNSVEILDVDDVREAEMVSKIQCFND
jgi:hypothetical protein